ncbi:MAG: D-aminoacylase [Prevotellaceae bacterium]|jgi:N-acyl-D-amino-acid deacylase|nr:D-aminoacylase [Prevotellaceae bacterium]
MSKKVSRRKFIKTSALMGCGIGLIGSGAFSSCISSRNRFDTIIKNGLVYSGNGDLPVVADIAVKDNKIAAIGKVGESANQIIDADNFVVSPGFIDIHTHTDTNLFICPEGDSRIYQGITTDVGGNCGGSPFPYSDKDFEKQKTQLRHGYPAWQHVDGFFDALEKNKISINYATFTGHGDLRSVIVGDNDIPATKEQIEQMKNLLQHQIDCGSIGISYGLEYAPGSYANTQELVEMCKVVAKNDALYAIHMRNEDDYVEEAIKEAIDVARQSGARLEISHLKAQNANNWHKAPNMLKIIEEAYSSGVDVAFDRYPYIAFSTGLSTFIPLWARQGSNDEVLARLKDKANFEKIRQYAESRIKRLGGGQNVIITSGNGENAEFIGKNLIECAEISHKKETEFIRDILLAEKGHVDMVCFAMTEDNVKMFLSHKLGMPASDGYVYSPVGELSTGKPHPRSYGTFPRFLGKYCRDEKIVDLSTGIMKMTKLPASRLNLKNRGTIEIGNFADIVVFDINKIIDKAEFTNPHQFAAGIEHVFVNGVHTINSGKHTGARNGMILRLR